MAKGVLVDITKCVGCGSCVVACKMWNDLGYIEGSPYFGKEADLTAENWTAVKWVKTKKDNQPVWRFVKNQCLHCKEPACVSSCFARAFQKTKEGPVVYDYSLCVGCRYCMLACPFDIPAYEWNKVFPRVRKCQMCAGRVKENKSPACTEVCPTGALQFGEREQLLNIARQRINQDSNYINHIYGEKEAGGTSWIYISDVPFKELGFRTSVPSTPPSHYTEKILSFTPAVAVGWGALLTGLYVYNRRRNEIAREESEEE